MGQAMMRIILRYIAVLVMALGLTGYSVGTPAQAAPASLAISPSSGIPGTAISVTGSGFSANETGITVTYDAAPVASGITANSVGSWSGSFVVPASASGPHSVGAYGSVTPAGSVTGTTFTVTATISISTTSGPAGSSVSVTGSGFAANESGITVTFDGAAVVSGISASSRGFWSANIAIPAAAAGSHTIAITGSVTPSLSVGFTIVPGMSISQSSGASGTSVTVTGSGFAASETGITVTYDGATVATGIAANSQGAWTATFVVPASAAGAHTIHAYGSITTSARDLVFTIVATVTVSRGGGAPGGSVTVSGNGFSAFESGITVTFDGVPVATGLSASAQGAWSTSITIPPLPSGSHNIHAYGATTAASSTTDVPFLVGPGISASRSSGPPGSSVTVTGAGFGASESGITITYDGANVASGLRANSAGSWNASFLVPPSTAGSHTIRASSPAGNTADVAFTVTPTVSASQTGGTPGGSVTVSGSGFAAAESGITVTYDGNIVASGIRASSTGSWSASFVVPPSTSGPHAIHAYGSSTSAASTSDVTFNVTAGISIGQPSGAPGSSMTVTGAGFAAAESGITITYDGNIVASGIRANSTGSWNTSFVIPPSASGPHTVHAYGSVTQTASTLDVTFTVTPGISVSQASGAPGTSMTVSGAGFAAAESGITVTYDSTTVASGLRADSLGSWNASFVVPPSVAGSHTIRASGSVTQVGVLTEIVFSVTASLSLSPDTGYVGMQVAVSGSGFAANSPLRFSYDSNEIPVQGTTTDASGSFSQSVMIPKSKAGTHTIRVMDGQRGDARATFTIGNTPPPAPTLLFPEDGARIGILGDVTPTFRWSSVTDPNGITYILQIDTYPDFAQPVLQKSDITGNRYTPSAGEALPRGIYYWRVKAVNGASVESQWPETRLFNSGLLPLWALVLITVLALATAGVAIYLFWTRPRVRRREMIPAPEVQVLPAAPGPWRVIGPGEPAAQRQLPWRLALPQPVKGTAPFSAQDQARLMVIVDFAQSLPLIEPGYNVKWLVDLIETQSGSKASPPVYEQLLKGELQVHYEPAWLSHPVYQDLTAMLEGQPVLQDLNAFVGSVNQYASDAISLLQDIYRDTMAEVSPDFLDRGGWEFISGIHSDALGWFRGKNLREPSERDYTTEHQTGAEEGAEVFWLYGESPTSFAGPLAQAPDEEEASRLLSLHLRLRRDYRGNDQARQVAANIAQLEVQRTRLLSIFSQLGNLKQQ